ncbi:MAG: hypothetical protein KF824_05820 [Fimbriimonadaceae bacterium]|nr:MAG: hypothetical protein KF824_05820 [Fimbriimonadaceae bacterium]
MSWFTDYLSAVKAQPCYEQVIVQDRAFQVRTTVGYDEVQHLVQTAKRVLNEIRMEGVRAESAELSDDAIASAVAISELIINPLISLDQALEIARTSGLLFAELAEKVDAVGRL